MTGFISRWILSLIHIYAVYLYDANNNLIQYTNRNNEWVKYAYDCMNRQVKETNQLNHATEYEYDLAGNQTAVKMCIRDRMFDGYEQKQAAF